jgi:opacity protein-like surface antigen
MKPKFSLLSLLAISAATALAGTADKKVITPPEPADKWEVLLSMPGWIAGFGGDVGIGNLVSNVDLPTNKLIPHIDMAASFRGEVRKGRFGAQADVLYLSLSDGIGGSGMVQKLDVRLDEILTDFGLNYRLIEGRRGWVDVIAGFRYTNVFQRETLHPNAANIQTASTELVDAASRLAGTALRNAVSDIVNGKLEDLRGRDPNFPIGPLGGRLPEAVRERVQAIIDARKAELTAAIASNVQPRIDAAKARLSNELSQTLNDKLDTRFSRTDDWFDPYVGLRARYNLNEKFYVTTRADIGGFGVGSDLTWQVAGAVGCQLSSRIFAEAGYRYLYVDYNSGGLVWDVATRGAEITIGINF